jgi:hypothetical protein
MIERFINWPWFLFSAKYRRRLDLIERYLRAAESYDEMAELADNVKPIPWREYCRLMACIRRNDAAVQRTIL